MDVRIARQQLRERRQENRFGGVLARRDADAAGGLRAEVAQCRELLIDLLKPWPNPLE
jgi:hypothetical protein